jgi:hypothetical protein
VLYSIDEDGNKFDEMKKKFMDKHGEISTLWSLRKDIGHRWRFAIAAACTRRATGDWRTIHELMNASEDDEVTKSITECLRDVLSRRTPGRRAGGGVAIVDMNRTFQSNAPAGSVWRLAECGTYDITSHHAAGEREPKKRRRELSKRLVDLCSGGAKGNSGRATVHAPHHIIPLMKTIFKRVEFDAAVCEPLIETVVSIVHARSIAQAVPPSGSYILSDSGDSDEDS